jgi:hypothetical protein
MRLELACTPGYEIILPRVASARGDRSRELRLLDQRLERVESGNGETGLVAVLEGPAGSTADVLVRRGETRAVRVTFPTGGDSVDGYSRSELRVAMPAGSGEPR